MAPHDDPGTLAGIDRDEAGASISPSPVGATGSRFSLTYAGHAVRLPEGETILGRGESATIAIDSRGVSRRHARIVVEGDRVTIEDLHSRNGTWVGTEKIDSAREIVESVLIRVGPVWFMLQSVEER